MLIKKLLDHAHEKMYDVVEGLNKPSFGYGEKYAIIYHQNCMDGLYAAWLMEVFLNSLTVKPVIDFYPTNYGRIPHEFDEKDINIIIVDFSYPNDILNVIAQSCKSLLVIDHHKKALENLLDKDKPTSENTLWSAIISDEKIEKISASGMISGFIQECASKADIADYDEVIELGEFVSRYDTWQHDGHLESVENKLQLFFYNQVLAIYEKECKVFGHEKYQGFNPDVTDLGNYFLDNWKRKCGDCSNVAIIKGAGYQFILNEEAKKLKAPFTYIFDNTDCVDPDRVQDLITVQVYPEVMHPRLLPVLTAPDTLGDTTNTLIVAPTHISSEDGIITYSIRWHKHSHSELPINANIVASLYKGGGHEGASGFTSDRSPTEVYKDILYFVDSLIFKDHKN